MTPQEVELEAAENDFLAAFVAVIEAYGQVRFVKTPHFAWLRFSLHLSASCTLPKRLCISGNCCCHALQTPTQCFIARDAKLMSDHAIVVMAADKLGIPVVQILHECSQLQEQKDSSQTIL